MWKGNGNATSLLFSLKGLGTLHQERRGQVKTIVMENFNCILLYKSGPANNHSLICMVQSLCSESENGAMVDYSA